MMIFVLDRLENIVGKKENSGYQYFLAPATRGLRNWWLPSPLWHMGGKSPQKQRRPIIIEKKLIKLVQNY